MPDLNFMQPMPSSIILIAPLQFGSDRVVSHIQSKTLIQHNVGSKLFLHEDTSNYRLTRTQKLSITRMTILAYLA